MSLKFTWTSALAKIPQALSSTAFAALISLLLVAFYNASFFSALAHTVDYHSLRGALFILNVALLLACLTFILVAALTLPYIAKPVMALLLLAAASAAYFMDTYGVVMHGLMIQNALETDAQEVRGLLSKSWIIYVLALGVLPSVLVVVTRLQFAHFGRELWLKCKSMALALLLALALIASMSADYAAFFRNHKDIRYMANPLTLIAAGASYLKSKQPATAVMPIEHDASINSLGKRQAKPTLLILVVGETARADHFGLNGYSKDTTPLLAQQPIINFSQVQSCGTETAVSVPCMFSNLGRADYSDHKAKAQEGLLDVIKHAGISVLWRDNNSSCKGTCDRVSYESVQRLAVPELCNERECFDAVLLHNLDEKLAAVSGSQVIVLHQKGSHGPDYFNRYPADREFFRPTCKDSELENCSAEEVVNAFDNTIRYTDYFLDSTLKWLASKQQDYSAALLYVSDHGESLGENRLYLHGMPYAIAPQAQKHVPMFMWLSEGFAGANGIDSQCLRERSQAAYSHDNLFHTVLGMLNISTQVYSAELDMLKPCRTSAGE